MNPPAQEDPKAEEKGRKRIYITLLLTPEQEEIWKIFKIYVFNKRGKMSGITYSISDELIDLIKKRLQELGVIKK